MTIYDNHISNIYIYIYICHNGTVCSMHLYISGYSDILISGSARANNNNNNTYKMRHDKQNRTRLPAYNVQNYEIINSLNVILNR